MYVFSPVFGVIGGSETYFQPQFSQVISVLGLSSLLFTYHRGKKKKTLYAYTHTFHALHIAAVASAFETRTA